MTRTVLMAALVALACTGPARAQTQNVYTTSPSAPQSGTSQINGLATNAQTGALTPLPTSPTNERLDGATLAVDALGRFLFVLNPKHNDISMFQIDSSTGALTEVPASPFAVGPFLNPQQAPADPVALATEPSGHYLYVGFNRGSFQTVFDSNTLDGAINAFLINPQALNGPALVPLSTPEIDLPDTPPVQQGMATDAHGRNVYVAYGSGLGETPSGIGVLKIDPNTGLLTFPFDSVNQGQHGRAMAIDPQARFVYLAHGENVGQVSGWPLSPVDGTAGAPINEVIYGTGQFPYAMAEESSGHYLICVGHLSARLCNRPGVRKFDRGRGLAPDSERHADEHSGRSARCRSLLSRRAGRTRALDQLSDRLTN
jgi:6-phosphogluconolactonase (cycloisomerase 2 family)